MSQPGALPGDSFNKIDSDHPRVSTSFVSVERPRAAGARPVIEAGVTTLQKGLASELAVLSDLFVHEFVNQKFSGSAGKN